MVECAYCGNPFGPGGKRSREHLFPDWLSKFRGTPKITSSVAIPGNKTIPGDLTIRDVCEPCNNGPLGDLDAYAKSLLMPVLKSTPGEIRLRLDDRILRWVLKVEFNGHRAASGPHSAKLQVLTPFILGEADRTTVPVDLLLSLIQLPEGSVRIDLGDDKIGWMNCFGPAVDVAPYVSVGTLLMLVLVWRLNTIRAERRRELRQWDDLGLTRTQRGASEIRLVPGNITADTWMQRASLVPREPVAAPPLDEGE